MDHLYRLSYHGYALNGSFSMAMNLYVNIMMFYDENL